MLQRTSSVDHLNVDIVSFASTVQLGDAKIVNSHSRALAVQREAEIYIGGEGNFSRYPVFLEPLPFLPITENLSFAATHINPIIKVRKIAIIGISNASILQAGNSEIVSLETRVKHIRQLLPRPAE